MSDIPEPWGPWDAWRDRPETALEFAENMIACLDRAPARERDRYWEGAMVSLIQKRDELRAQLGVQPEPEAPRQLELLG